MFFMEFGVGERKSIWTETSASWDETHPSWKIVGKNPMRVIKSHLCEDGTELSPDETRQQSLEHILACEQRCYRLSFASGREIVGLSRNAHSPGCYVIVEADRGEDCALVREAVHFESGYGEAGNNGSTTILRMATPQDIEILQLRQKQEMRALEKCVALVKEHDYPMEITRCEFQWDMRKITFYFRSTKRVDFRELVKELFKYFKIRIWMSMENRSSLGNAMGM